MAGPVAATGKSRRFNPDHPQAQMRPSSRGENRGVHRRVCLAVRAPAVLHSAWESLCPSRRLPTGSRPGWPRLRGSSRAAKIWPRRAPRLTVRVSSEASNASIGMPASDREGKTVSLLAGGRPRLAARALVSGRNRWVLQTIQQRCQTHTRPVAQPGANSAGKVYVVFGPEPIRAGPRDWDPDSRLSERAVPGRMGCRRAVRALAERNETSTTRTT